MLSPDGHKRIARSIGLLLLVCLHSGHHAAAQYMPQIELPKISSEATPAPAAAPNPDDLRLRIDALEHAIQELKAQAAGMPTDKPATSAAAQPDLTLGFPGASDSARTAAENKPNNDSSQDTPGKSFFGWDDNSFILRSADKDFALRITGQLQNDYRGFLGSDQTADIDTFLIRRARLGIEADMYRYYEFRLLPDFDPNGSGAPRLEDGYINVHYWDAFQLETGRFKEPVSYEQLIQDRFVPTMERSLIDQLVPGRDVGAMIHGEGLFGGRFFYAAGIFNGTIGGNNDTDDQKDIAARLAVMPFYTADCCYPLLQYLQLGVSGSTGFEQEPVTPATLRTPATIPWFTFKSGVREDGVRYRISPEISWFYGPFGVAAQYYHEQEELTPDSVNLVNVPIQGFYLMGTALLTGETRKTWSEAIAPSRPFNPCCPCHSPGAIETGRSRVAP